MNQLSSCPDNSTMDSCRTCLRQEFAVTGYSLFDTVVRPIPELLMVCTSLKILKNDGLPDRICDDCYAKLAGFQAFCKQAIESDVFHRQKCAVKIESTDDEPTAKTKSTDPGHPIAAEFVKIESTAMAACPLADDDNNYRLPSSAGDSDSNCAEPATRKSRAKRPYAPRPGSRITDKSIRFECDMCGKHLYDKLRLTGHLRQHCGLRPFQCDQCPKLYDKISKLREHQKRHAPPQPEQPTPCPHDGCCKTFRYPRLAKDHYERVHLRLRAKRRAECICEACGKSFMTRGGLLQHTKSHIDVEQYPFQCEVCHKRFLAKNGYKLHMLRHNNIRNFPCPLCPSRMVSQLELNYHMANHDRSVSWPCVDCEMVFQRRASLRRHERNVHPGSRRYVPNGKSRGAKGEMTLIVK